MSLYSKLKSKADKFYQKELNKAKTKGLYENFGWKLQQKFDDELQSNKYKGSLSYSEKHELSTYLSCKFINTEDKDLK